MGGGHPAQYYANEYSMIRASSTRNFVHLRVDHGSSHEGIVEVTVCQDFFLSGN